MNHTFTLHRPVPHRLWLALIMGIALWVASAISLAPALNRSAFAVSYSSVSTASLMSAEEHSKVCHCAHCPGGANCCCSAKSAVCPTH